MSFVKPNDRFGRKNVASRLATYHGDYDFVTYSRPHHLEDGIIAERGLSVNRKRRQAKQLGKEKLSQHTTSIDELNSAEFDYNH
jgi:hypothetical protein